MTEAEKKADEKLALLQSSKAKIQLVKSDYENKLRKQHLSESIMIKHFPKRMIILSDTLETPTLDNLWNYLSHFYDKIAPSQKDLFEFEDLAGIYTKEGLSRLFAVCIRYIDRDGLTILPEGKYLCANCTEKNRTSKLNELLQTANSEYHIQPNFTIQQIILSGILQWNYEIQLYLG